MDATDRKHMNTSCSYTPVKSQISIAKSVYGYIRTKVTAGHRFRTDLSVRMSEGVNSLLLQATNDCGWE